MTAKNPEWTVPTQLTGETDWTSSSLSFTPEFLDNVEVRYDLIVGKALGEFLVHQFENGSRTLATSFETEDEARSWAEARINGLIEENAESAKYWDEFNRNT